MLTACGPSGQHTTRMGRHELDDDSEPEGDPEESKLEQRFRFSYTDIAEGVGATGLAGIVAAEIVQFGPANLALFTAAGLLAYDIARRHDTGRADPPT